MKKHVSLPLLFMLTVAVMLLGVSLLAGPVPAMAEEASLPGRTVTIYKEDGAEDVSKKVSDAFADQSVEQVNVIDLSLRNSVNPEGSEATPYRAGYTARNRKFLNTAMEGVVIARTQGLPGMNIGINATKGVSNTYSCSFSISTGAISACVGFTVTKTEQIQVSCSETVPYTVGSKKVTSMTLMAHPLFDYYSYDVYQNGNYVGKGYAGHAVGCAFRRSYQYA